MPGRDLIVFTGGTAAVLAGGALARRHAVTPVEAQCFRAVNAISSRVRRPVWVGMQLGSFGGVLATSAIAAVTGRRALAERLFFAGASTWVGAKLAKRFVRRERPSSLVDSARVLGRAQSGLGYPSGHAAVAAALASVAAPSLPRSARVAVWALALAVGPARIYFGAHLPLDVAGGVAFGAAAGAATRLVAG
jgi:glycosyltransferase 2 family protein